MEEIVDLVDAGGRVLRQVTKGQAHVHGWLHKTVIGCLRDGEDWVFARQAADRQDAGQLVVPVGGHVRAGESDLAALFREAEEEIGVRHVSYVRIGTAILHRNVIGRNENHLFVVYEIATTDSIILGNESVAIERMTPTQHKRALIERPKDFGEAHYFLLEKFYRDYLPTGWQNRWGE